MRGAQPAAMATPGALRPGVHSVYSAIAWPAIHPPVHAA